LGEQKIRDLWLGKLPYTDPGLVSTLKLVEDLRNNKVLYPGAISMANKEAEINFANEKAAMMLNGSWAVNVYLGMNPNLKMGVFPFPKPDDAQNPMYIIGGVGKGCAVTANSEYPEAAVAFLRWFTSKEQQVRLAKEAHEIPANFSSMDDLDPLLKGFAEGMRNLTPDLKNEEKFEVREVLSKGMQSILIGEAKPEDILKQAEEIKKKVTGK
jgi:raffinose/stachyose/melibiose transport system substrate-binding protein